MVDHTHDPVVAHYRQFVDRNQLRAHLRLSVDERLEQMRRTAAATPARRRPPPQSDRPWQPLMDCGPDRPSDPITELFKQDIDRTLLRQNLQLTPDERLRKLQDFVRFMETVRSATASTRGTA